MQLGHIEVSPVQCHRHWTVITTIPRIYLFWMLDDDVGFQSHETRTTKHDTVEIHDIRSP
jgi:hypothetical protein